MLFFQQQIQIANQANPQAATTQPQQRLMRPVMPNNPGLRHLLQQVSLIIKTFMSVSLLYDFKQPQFRQMTMQQMGNTGPRQMGQQMPNASGNQQATFDDVTNFDFNIM